MRAAKRRSRACAAIETVKFSDLLATRARSGRRCLATGHYVRRVVGAGGPELHRARRSGARPELFPVRHHARRSSISCAFRWAACPSARRARWRARLACGRRQARQPGHLLRARRRLCATSWSSCGPRPPSRARSSTVDGAVLGRHHGRHPFHRRPAPRAWHRRSGDQDSEPLFVMRLDAATAAGRRRPARGAWHTARRAARRELAGRRAAIAAPASRCWRACVRPARRRRRRRVRRRRAEVESAGSAAKKASRRGRPASSTTPRRDARARRRLDRAGRAATGA